MKRLIVNADDFGQSAGINDGIVLCHEQGILTSASLMVRWPHAAAAATYARTHPNLSVGLHIDLGEWINTNGTWTERYIVTDTDSPELVAAEIHRQLEMFRELMGADPTHLDSHQHVHRSAPASGIVIGLGRELRVPVRSAGGLVRYDGAFYGQGTTGDALHHAVTTESLVEILCALPDGTTELGCHPGLRGDADGMYVSEREREVRTLCDPRVRAAIEAEHIELISFHDVTRPRH